MTAEKLYSILKFLDELDKKLGLQTSLEAVRDALNNLVSSPANPPHQSALATALDSLSAAATRLGEAITPSQATVIKELGGGEFFDPHIADKVREVVQMNAMTPSVPRDSVQKLAERRAAFLATVRGGLQHLTSLNIQESTLKAGSADVTFLIPRTIFDNRLGSFAKELTFISRLLEHTTEAVTGEMQPVELEQLASSIPTVSLLANPLVLSLLATVVNKFLEAWERIEKIRRIRKELKEMGIEGAPVDVLTEQITTTVEEVVEESTQMIVVNSPTEDGRKHELENALRQDTRRLFGQIERGLMVEFRTQPGGKPEDADASKAITNLSKTMRFPEVAKEPLLLENGQIIEGEIQVKRSKKTTTKTTTSKKEPREPKAEEKK
jgi:hypothetical protein